MGMYDTIKINKDLLPISDYEKTLVTEDIDWQTKDFNSCLTEIYINDDGTLDEVEFEYEEVPIEERPYPNADGFMKMAGSMRRTNERKVRLYHHGMINFYSHIDDEWFEFRAKFTDGIMVDINRINSTEQIKTIERQKKLNSI